MRRLLWIWSPSIAVHDIDIIVNKIRWVCTPKHRQCSHLDTPGKQARVHKLQQKLMAFAANMTTPW